MSLYTKVPYETGRDSSVLQCQPLDVKRVEVKPELPGNTIAIHGVNDVGVSYAELEAGLCAGLNDRLAWGQRFQSADYRMPVEGDKGKLLDDPDAVFFKRWLKEGHHTPVIPFYWGFREDEDAVKNGQHPDNIHHGQNTDRHGNRLDKDFSKGGGPFANATSTLVDMWNLGFGAGPKDAVDVVSQDPIRPVHKGQGRLYMVLAAQRLAALISMIRDYDPNEVVNLVAHSQGCMLSLLAQAFLLQKGLRPADTLVLTHPPYSLVDDVPWTSDVAEEFTGGNDETMRTHYGDIRDRQTLHARLQTLVNIVHGVVKSKHTTPQLAELGDPALHCGMVGTKWRPDADRDNRGKVYLYFCPEDMTVALDNVQGIGWQGVPDLIDGQRGQKPRGQEKTTQGSTREALKELMACNGKDRGFFQRVFTAKLRGPDGQPPQPVLVGAPPHDFVLRLKGEDDHGHVTKSTGNMLRAHHPEVDPHASRKFMGMLDKPMFALRRGVRRITGEALKTPVRPDMHAGAIKGSNGKLEEIDPIDAAISVTSRYGWQAVWQLVDDPTLRAGVQVPPPLRRETPALEVFGDQVAVSRAPKQHVEALVNAGKTNPSQMRRVLEYYECLKTFDLYQNPATTGQLLVKSLESADEARLRRQLHGRSDRSFHGAIFGSRFNHQHVTAYDLAIGGGKAVSDPLFYDYLCAVADWRLKKPEPKKPVRPGILEWKKFQKKFGVFYSSELDWRRALIEGNCDYYSTGKLPDCLPLLPAGLPPTVISETMDGRRIEHAPGPAPKPVKTAEALNTGEWMAQNPLPENFFKDFDSEGQA